MKIAPYSREYWRGLLPVISAFTEGKTIQAYNDDGIWRDSFSFVPNSDPNYYRIKPSEPFRLNTLEEQVEILTAKLMNQWLEFRTPLTKDEGWLYSGNKIPDFKSCQYRIAKKGE